ncbi:hypothetical protein LSH36_26g09051 [Paralvinella palmiformis]|uniref:Rho GDP-dissociation inhibitor 3 n=1 Tax=Paralvinella palmiformis TaxID=53620 RepID=A0AAD9KAH7_9ANNE|nr:hypothetical protein LSH36_26g09051 [Paralvinella palmiformis]
MADAGQGDHEHDQEDETTPGYKPPAEKPLDQILQLDQDDESLKKYKEQLLGGTNVAGLEVFPEDPRHVIVIKCALLVDGRPDIEMDLAPESVKELKKKTFLLKEGCSYRMCVYFYVQRDIVTGLRFTQKSFRKGIQVDKMNHMVGSYGPKKELQSYTTPPEEVPSGMLARGHYTNKSLFTDDDKNEHLKWEWNLEIKKDWKD